MEKAVPPYHPRELCIASLVQFVFTMAREAFPTFFTIDMQHSNFQYWSTGDGGGVSVSSGGGGALATATSLVTAAVGTSATLLQVGGGPEELALGAIRVQTSHGS